MTMYHASLRLMYATVALMAVAIVCGHAQEKPIQEMPLKRVFAGISTGIVMDVASVQQRAIGFSMRLGQTGALRVGYMLAQQWSVVGNLSITRCQLDDNVDGVEATVSSSINAAGLSAQYRFNPNRGESTVYVMVGAEWLYEDRDRILIIGDNSAGYPFIRYFKPQAHRTYLAIPYAIGGEIKIHPRMAVFGELSSRLGAGQIQYGCVIGVIAQF